MATSSRKSTGAWARSSMCSTRSTLRNTIVIFTSDNGPLVGGQPRRHAGRENLPFEGGYRVPCLVRWPGVTSAGSVLDGLSVNFDILPTLLAAAGIPGPHDRTIDRRDMRPLPAREVDRFTEPVYYYKWHRLLGVRHGDWKYALPLDRQRRLPDPEPGALPVQPGDRSLRGLATPVDSEPAIAAELEAMLNDWEDAIDHNVRGWTAP